MNSWVLGPRGMRHVEDNATVTSVSSSIPWQQRQLRTHKGILTALLAILAGISALGVFVVDHYQPLSLHLVAIAGKASSQQTKTRRSALVWIQNGGPLGVKIDSVSPGVSSALGMTELGEPKICLLVFDVPRPCLNPMTGHFPVKDFAPFSLPSRSTRSLVWAVPTNCSQMNAASMPLNPLVKVTYQFLWMSHSVTLNTGLTESVVCSRNGVGQ